jgi:MFS family permease
VIAATVLGSGIAFLDSTVVNVALPHIGEEFDTDVGGLQWVLSGYLLAVSSLILLGGSLGDRFGRKRIFQLGVVIFAVASLLCAVAPNAPLLVVARVVQGIGGALLTPGSLAILEASFRPSDRGRAIGAWSGLSGVAGAIGPFVGGWLVDAASWRWIFLINLPISAAVVAIAARHVPETADPEASHSIDYAGAALMGIGLGGVTWALIAAGDKGWGDPVVWGPLLVGAAALALFVPVERRERAPMVPPAIFASAQFRAANLVTAAMYAALGGIFFLLVVQLQNVLGYSAIEAGAATLPITLLMTRIEPGVSYVSGVLPAVLVTGLGLATVVAPLTATALSAVEDRHAGVASGVNTTVARVAQLVAVAGLPLLAGITGRSYLDPSEFSSGFRTAMVITAALSALGGVLGFLTVRNPEPVPGEAPAPAPTGWFCGTEGPPLDTCPRAAAGSAEEGRAA